MKNHQKSLGHIYCQFVSHLLDDEPFKQSSKSLRVVFLRRFSVSISRCITMDVDPPHNSVNNTSNLKRSSSAPMINVLGNTPSCRESLSPTSHLLLTIPRTRRLSASFSASNSPSSPVAAVPSRVNQIKHEEGMDVTFRETAHEKEVQSKIRISQSWDDLTLDEGSLNDPSKRPRSLTDPLHIFTPPPGICNSPSPTRTSKQCFSPSTCMNAKQFSPSPSPSPTRKSFSTRRSQSPIMIRPSQFSAKRKFDIDMEQGDFVVPTKKINLGGTLHELNPASHSLNDSLSQNSLDAISSPDQTVPHEGTDITDSMSSSSGSPCCSSFHPVDPAPTTQDNSCTMEDS